MNGLYSTYCIWRAAGRESPNPTVGVVYAEAGWPHPAGGPTTQTHRSPGGHAAQDSTSCITFYCFYMPENNSARKVYRGLESIKINGHDGE